MLPLVFILAMGLFSLDPGELIPLLMPDLPPSDSLRQLLAPLGGVTAVVFFAGFYDKQRLGRCLLGGTAALSAFSALILLCCVGVFSIRGTERLEFPLTELSRIVSVGNVSLNHRFDILYIMIYNAVTLISAGILLYGCCVSLCGVFEVKSHSCFIFPLLPVLFVISYYSLSDDSAILFISDWGKLLLLSAVIPTVFAVMSLRKLRRKKS